MKRPLPLLLLLLLSAGCAHRVCGRLDAAQIEAFHNSHALSVTANASSVAELASENWEVCVENGHAEIQNHCAAADGLVPASQSPWDGGCGGE